MKMLMFIAASAFFVLLIRTIHFRFFGKVQLLWFKDKFDPIPLAELLILVAYLYWAFTYLFGGKEYYALLIIGFTTLLIVLPLILILRDFVPGMAIRSDIHFKPGAQVELNNQKAEISKLGLLRMVLKTEKGDNYMVPYSKIRSLSYQGANLLNSSDYHCFRIAVNDIAHAPRSIDQIRQALLASPWVPARSEPKVQLLNKTGEDPAIEVCVNAISPTHAMLIEQRIKKKLQQD